ncbi:MAG: hypothetical protein AB7E53_13065, partial [Macellibacteroides sp.]|uniref:hypothetical protein n=1 Tax=Macellibacteroides sp. TaxID=2014584 RepID=UPI003E6F843D
SAFKASSERGCTCFILAIIFFIESLFYTFYKNNELFSGRSHIKEESLLKIKRSVHFGKG